MKEYKDFGEVCLNCGEQLEYSHTGDDAVEVWQCTECKSSHNVPMIRDWANATVDHDDGGWLYDQYKEDRAGLYD